MGKFIMNGVEYTSSPMNGFPPLIYSDEEREVGVWRDGKPLYQKAIFFSQGVTLSTNWTDINANIPVDLIVYASAYRNSDGFYNILKASQGNNTGEISIRLESGSFSADVVLMQYTKTTDTAGSGKYTTYGGLTHHYSTTEQVIGTWIDGKPLYEISVSDDTERDGSLSSEQTIYVNISNIKEFIDFSGFASFGTNNQWMPMLFSDASGNNMTNSRLKMIALNP